jgi:hypothetical protein
LGSLIVTLLSGSHQSSTDQTDRITRPGLARDDQPASYGEAEGQEAILVVGVIWIWKGHRKGIAKDSRGLFEGDTVFLEVRGCLLGVPDESHAVAARLNAKPDRRVRRAAVRRSGARRARKPGAC